LVTEVVTVSDNQQQFVEAPSSPGGPRNARIILAETTRASCCGE
jgi:hypothetical protein